MARLPRFIIPDWKEGRYKAKIEPPSQKGGDRKSAEYRNSKQFND